MDRYTKNAVHPHLIGYVRMSIDDQKLDLQIAALIAAEIRPNDVRSDKTNSLRSEQPVLAGALKAFRRSDTLMVWRLDRLAHSTKELLPIGDRLQEAKVSLRSLSEYLDTSTATGKLVFTLVSTMAEFERNLISERTKSGMSAARDRGLPEGHPAKLVEKRLSIAEFVVSRQ
ncbi:recombinase family protein [Azospirillum lipoferum]|uniref:Site-specific DNA recombinase n=1 Tax=Azospirillum lipoferum (strain 4B) TaxID=862719 RepID=G7ZEM3_AZOL4|nr:recombinase family protein [Azospirillum lipoferum]CBS90234.1 site-specific DNA recombinase [Azospirillum lipoferum 4B]